MAIKATSINLFSNSSPIANNTRLVRSKKKEDDINSSDQIPPGGIIVIVAYDDVAYAKLTDGNKPIHKINTLLSELRAAGIIST